MSDEDGFSMVELSVVCLLLGVVLSIVLAALIATNRAVSAASERAINNADAQRAVSLIEANLRSASGVSTTSSILWVANSSTVGTSQPACTGWQLSGNALKEFVGPSESAPNAQQWSNILTN
jgi:Tfp pilus assembly protein PilW